MHSKSFEIEEILFENKETLCDIEYLELMNLVKVYYQTNDSQELLNYTGFLKNETLKKNIDEILKKSIDEKLKKGIGEIWNVYDVFFNIGLLILFYVKINY
jgi:hypothetical protein